MAKYQTELFGHFFYHPDLSYDELLELEQSLKEVMQKIFEADKANFVHFEAEGDSLLVQCVFSSFGEDIFHSICTGLAPHMDQKIEGKLLMVDKTLDHILFYTLSQGIWKEASLDLPNAGPIEAQLQEDPN